MIHPLSALEEALVDGHIDGLNVLLRSRYCGPVGAWLHDGSGHLER